MTKHYLVSVVDKTDRSTTCISFAEKNAAVISLNITVGYKNTNTIKEGSWSILASGHVSRVMNCHYNENVSG